MSAMSAMSAYNGAYAFRPGYHGLRRQQPQSANAARTCTCSQFLVPHREGDDPRLIWPDKCPQCGREAAR